MVKHTQIIRQLTKIYYNVVDQLIDNLWYIDYGAK